MEITTNMYIIMKKKTKANNRLMPLMDKMAAWK